MLPVSVDPDALGPAVGEFDRPLAKSATRAGHALRELYLGLSQGPLLGDELFVAVDQTDLKGDISE